jgi:hypothetical protein
MEAPRWRVLEAPHHLIRTRSADCSPRLLATARTPLAIRSYSQLFADAAGQSFHIAEMAHICAANDGGPRANPDLSDRHGRTPTQVVLTVGYFALTE